MWEILEINEKLKQFPKKSHEFEFQTLDVSEKQ